MSQYHYHKMLLWTGDPVYITPGQRERLEAAWAADPKGSDNVLKTEGTTVIASDVAGFQVTKDPLPEKLLPDRLKPKELPPPQISAEQRRRNLERIAQIKAEAARKHAKSREPTPVQKELRQRLAGVESAKERQRIVAEVTAKHANKEKP